VSDVTYSIRRLTCDVADAVHDEFPTWNTGGDGDDRLAGSSSGH